MDAAVFQEQVDGAYARLRAGETEAAVTILEGLERLALGRAQRVDLALHRAWFHRNLREEERALERLEPLRDDPGLSDEQRAFLGVIDVTASAIVRRPVRPDDLYELLDRPLTPLARCQVLYALSYWHRGQEGDLYGAGEMEDRMLEELDEVTDPEWRLRLLAWSLPSGGGRQWDPTALARGEEALRLVRALGWRTEERRVCNQLFAIHLAREAYDDALTWVGRGYELAKELDHTDGLGLYHADCTSVALARGDVPTAQRHWEELLVIEAEMRQTAIGDRLMDLLQVLLDRASGRWHAAYGRIATMVAGGDGNNMQALSTWLRVLADQGDPADIAVAIADALALVGHAHDPYSVGLVHGAAEELATRDVDPALVRHLRVLTHRLARGTGHRRLEAEVGALLEASRGDQPGIVGPWALVRRLGRGAMGEAWLAEDVRDGRAVVVKLLLAEGTQDPRHIESLFSEARTMVGMQHPNLLQVLDYGHIDETEALTSPVLVRGAPYMVIELAEGGSLGASRGAWPWERVREVLLQVLQGLAHAHGREMLHLDIKPGNLLLRSDGTVAIADFGIARAVGVHQDRVAGTPAFMAPEQWRGRWQSLGPWTDLYAVGMVAIELLQGRPAFRVTDVAGLREAHLRRLPALQPAVDVPSGLEDWLLSLIAKAPQHRFPSAALAIQALQALGKPTRHAGAHEEGVRSMESTLDLDLELGLDTIRTLQVAAPFDSRPSDQETWVEGPVADGEGEAATLDAMPSGRRLQLPRHPRRRKPSVPKTHLDLLGLWPALEAHHPEALDGCWEALLRATDEARVVHLGLTSDTAETLDRFVDAFLTASREAGLRPFHVRREDGSFTGYMVRLVGLEGPLHARAAWDGLVARGLDGHLADRLVNARRGLSVEDVRDALQWLAGRSTVVLCLEAFDGRERLLDALREVRGAVLVLWVEPTMPDPERLDLRACRPTPEALEEAVVGLTGLGSEQVERLLVDVHEAGHAAARLVGHGIRGALVRRGERHVLRPLPLAPTCAEERARLLSWLYKRWEPPTRRVFELALSRRYVSTKWWWKASEQPLLCIDVADALFRAGLVVTREQGWTFVESSLRERALDLARSQGRSMPDAE